MKKLFFLFLLSFFIWSSCNHNKNTKNEVKAPIHTAIDSQTITIAILPTFDCLPLYIASQRIYQSLGISVKTEIYSSQMDAEQSVISGKCDGCATDLFRVGLLQNQKKPIRFLFSTQREWDLISNKLLRVSKVEQLNDRMIGITRNSNVDYLCDAVASAIKAPHQILRPQINSISTRLHMLENNQIDVAFLPQPYSLIARKQGNTLLQLPYKVTQNFSGIAFSTNAYTNKKMEKKLQLLLKGYNQAIDDYQKKKELPLSEQELNMFSLDMLTDSLKQNIKFKKGQSPTTESISTALKWLKQRKLIKSSYSADTLTYKIH